MTVGGFIRYAGLVVVAVATIACGSQSPTSTAPVNPSPVTPEPTPTPPPAPSPTETPLPSPSGPVTFVGAGDIGACDGNAELTAQLLDTTPGTVFTLGDHAYPRGAQAEWDACYEPTWGRHKARTRPSPGNHDYEVPDASIYYSYFGANAGPAGLGYYSFDLGAWHIVSLNSNVNIAAQVPWLQADLEAHRTRCVLAYFHHALYASGAEGSTPRVRDLWRVLYRSNADVVLSSHNHLYERFGPQDHDGQLEPVRGLRQFVVGTGGAPLHAPQERMPNSEFILSTFGVLKLTLKSDGYDWELLTAAGPRDIGSGQCH